MRTPDEMPPAEPPLWSIGLVVLLILVAPLLLYSLAPTGPLREGDTIFSEGQQRARPAPRTEHDGESCLLDPGTPLIILERPMDRPDGTVLAQVQGNPTSEWPFCPPHAEVLLEAHQIDQQPALVDAVKTRLAAWFGWEKK